MVLDKAHNFLELLVPTTICVNCLYTLIWCDKVNYELSIMFLSLLTKLSHILMICEIYGSTKKMSIVDHYIPLSKCISRTVAHIYMNNCFLPYNALLWFIEDGIKYYDRNLSKNYSNKNMKSYKFIFEMFLTITQIFFEAFTLMYGFNNFYSKIITGFIYSKHIPFVINMISKMEQHNKLVWTFNTISLKNASDYVVKYKDDNYNITTEHLNIMQNQFPKSRFVWKYDKTNIYLLKDSGLHVNKEFVLLLKLLGSILVYPWIISNKSEFVRFDVMIWIVYYLKSYIDTIITVPSLEKNIHISEMFKTCFNAWSLASVLGYFAPSEGNLMLIDCYIILAWVFCQMTSIYVYYLNQKYNRTYKEIYNSNCYFRAFDLLMFTILHFSLNLHSFVKVLSFIYQMIDMLIFDKIITKIRKNKIKYDNIKKD